MTHSKIGLLIALAGFSFVGVAAAVIAVEDNSSRSTSSSTRLGPRTSERPDAAVLDRTLSYSQGSTTLGPPSSDARSNSVPAKEALASFRADPLSSLIDGLGKPYLRLSSATIRDFGTPQADGSIVRVVGNRTVCAVIYSDVGWAGAHRGATATDGSDVVAFVDASTGKLINLEAFPRASSAKPFAHR